MQNESIDRDGSRTNENRYKSESGRKEIDEKEKRIENDEDIVNNDKNEKNTENKKNDDDDDKNDNSEKNYGSDNMEPKSENEDNEEREEKETKNFNSRTDKNYKNASENNYYYMPQQYPIGPYPQYIQPQYYGYIAPAVPPPPPPPPPPATVVVITNQPGNTSREEEPRQEAENRRNERFNEGQYPDDRLGLALGGLIIGVLAACLFCLPWIPSAIAITFASQTRTDIQKKNYDKAWKTSQSAQIAGAVGITIAFMGFCIWWGFFALAMVQYYDQANQHKYNMNWFLVALWWLPNDIRFPPKHSSSL